MDTDIFIVKPAGKKFRQDSNIRALVCQFGQMKKGCIQIAIDITVNNIKLYRPSFIDTVHNVSPFAARIFFYSFFHSTPQPVYPDYNLDNHYFPFSLDLSISLPGWARSYRPPANFLY